MYIIFSLNLGIFLIFEFMYRAQSLFEILRPFFLSFLIPE